MSCEEALRYAHQSGGGLAPGAAWDPHRIAGGAITRLADHNKAIVSALLQPPVKTSNHLRSSPASFVSVNLQDR
jgi:hypothetical protein